MVSKKPSILIVDNEQVVCAVLYDELSDQGYLCATAFNGNDALTKLGAQDFDVALVDIELDGMSGMEVLRGILSNHHDTAVIMITAVNSLDTAIEAMKLGASDYIVKPFDIDRINTSIRTVLKNGKRSMERQKYKATPCVGGEEDVRQAIGETFSQMNAIAHGVEARLDSLFGYSKIVTQRTHEIAQQLGIPEKEVQRWAAWKSMLNSERDRAIESSLNKFEKSPLAQSIMSMTELYMPTPESSESQN